MQKKRWAVEPGNEARLPSSGVATCTAIIKRNAVGPCMGSETLTKSYLTNTCSFLSLCLSTAKAKAVPRYQGPLCLCTTSSKSHNVCLVGIEEFFDHSSTLNTMTGTEFDQEFDQWVIDL